MESPGKGYQGPFTQDEDNQIATLFLNHFKETELNIEDLSCSDLQEKYNVGDIKRLHSVESI